MNDRLPTWISKAVVVTLITALIGGTFAWATGMTGKVSNQSEDIAVLKDNISDIKTTQRRMEDKLDRALERRE